jgi:hypothetical protein
MNINMTANHSNLIKSVTSFHSSESSESNDTSCLLVHNKQNNFSNKPSIQAATDNQDKVVVMENSESNHQQDWIAEPDISQQKSVNSEFNQLLTLNEELRQANIDLYSQVEKLKAEIAETDKILQWQKTRSTVTESMFNQQNQELSAAQEQIQLLYEQLDASVQNVQRQEIIIETYKSQLQISQHRLAQLERECSLLQTNYSEESQQLLHSQNTCHELRTRLMRQQRQTLQFKAALEKCLDKPVFNEEIIEDPFPANHNHNHRQTRFSRTAHSLLNNPQPIQPWSVDSEDVIPVVDNVDNDTIPEIPIYQVAEDVMIQNQPSVNLPDKLIEEVVTALSQIKELSHTASIDSTPNNNAKIEYEEVEDYWSDVPSATEVSLTEDAFIPILSEPIKEKQEDSQETVSTQQSPSPLIYPQRPPKGRKSLASVELPNFRAKPE